jgi:hypothetical protein
MDFKIGDTVVDVWGNLAEVTGVHAYLSVRWKNHPGLITGLWPAEDFKPFDPKPPRPAVVGNWYRVTVPGDYYGMVGFLYEDDGDDLEQDPFWLYLPEVDEESDEPCEVPFSASELEDWAPKVGERVIEKGIEDECGTVLRVTGNTVRVLWDEYPSAQDFDLSDLEPADESAADGFSEGDDVEYNNPFFAQPIKGVVVKLGDDRSFIKFPSGKMPD